MVVWSVGNGFQRNESEVNGGHGGLNNMDKKDVFIYSPEYMNNTIGSWMFSVISVALAS